MGQRGPVPKRSSERRRRNADSKPDVVTLKGVGRVEAKPADEKWHEIARDWYESLAQSGQALFYEPSDWAAARFVASELSVYCRTPAKLRSAVKFASLWTSMSDLLTTEGERRRVRLEIERDPVQQEDAVVVAIEDARKRLSG